MLSLSLLPRLSICNFAFIVDHRGHLFPSVVIVLLHFNLFLKLPTLIPLCSHRATAVQLSCVSSVHGSVALILEVSIRQMSICCPSITRGLELIFYFVS